MNTTTTAKPSKILSVDMFDPTTEYEAVHVWARIEFEKGVARFAKPGTPRWSAQSEPFAAGYAYAEAAVTGDTSDVLDLIDYGKVVAAAHRVNRQKATRLTAEQAAASAALAEALIADSAEASMQPLGLSHYESDAMSEAMATIEQYGKFDATTSEFSPFIVHRLEDDAERARHTATGSMPQPWALQNRVLAYINDKVDAGHVSKVTLQFETVLKENRDGSYSFAYPVGLPEIVFMTHSESSRATTERGEVGWALYFVPETYDWVDKTTGEVITKAAWKSDRIEVRKHKAVPRSLDTEGNAVPEQVRLNSSYASPVNWVGVCRVFKSYDEMTDAEDELRRALRTIRDADLEARREAEGELRITRTQRFASRSTASAV